MTSSLQFEPWIVDLIAFVLGAVVGSFLNVLALRTLEERSIAWPPSSCPHCGKLIAFYDNVPVLSFLILGGRCRQCKQKISWQYPAVELITAVLSAVLVHRFGLTFYTAGILVFAYTLIAVTITDLKEKLIPHDITYPSIIIGLIFSFFVRNDLLGALAAVGASYLIFDFLAHYGLKFYLAFYVAKDKTADNADNVRLKKAGETGDQALNSDDEKAPKDSDEEYEDIEVMGGGDAVLSAVIGSYLGWQRLILALVVGFVVGTIMGLYFLAREMHKANLLRQCIRPALICSTFGALSMCLLLYLLSLTVAFPVASLPWATFAAAGFAAGLILAVVSVGTRVSKPFPFGPALAIGGLAAVFAEGFVPFGG
jgi:prepilin signal peptidase PulO-like enzyme (type II secretory pathway)